MASVDVTGGGRQPHLFINGVGITRLTIITKLLAYVPKAARPDATTMLNICFGMGTTYRSSSFSACTPPRSNSTRPCRR